MRGSFTSLPLFIAGILAACFCQAASADYSEDGFGNIGLFTSYANPSNSEHVTNSQFGTFSNFYTFISCYDEDDPAVLLNCPFTFTVVGLADQLANNGLPPLTGYDEGLIDGGHTHNTADVRPLLFPPNGVSIAGETPTPYGTLTVSGNTNSDTAQVVYPVPEEGGMVATSIRVFAPEGWFCAAYCYDDTSWLDANVVAIGHFQRSQSASSLFHVPQFGTDYTIIDSSEQHFDKANGYTYGSYLTDASYDLLLRIAHVYSQLAGSKVSVNDMSLPVGGRFDYPGHWRPPHHGHRDGVAADINRRNIAGVLTECGNDHALIQAVISVIGYDVPHWKKLYCEKQWNADGTPLIDPTDHLQVENKHINFSPPALGTTGD